MSNVSGKAYAINVLTPASPRRASVNRFLYMLSRVLPESLLRLMGLSMIHFARWVIIKRNQWPDLGQGPQRLQNDYLLFCSNFNGTWDKYIDAFSDGLPGGLDLFWYSSTKYPHSIPLTPFKSYIKHNQITTNYYYNATPGVGQRDIKSALAVRRALKTLATKHASQQPRDFLPSYHAALREVQNCLGSQGFAPVASNDTRRAEQLEQSAIQARWGGRAGPPAAREGGSHAQF